MRSARTVRANVKASRASAIKTVGESMAIQSEKENCDINVIVRRFGVTGSVPLPRKLPTYGDFSQIMDFRTALDAVREAEQAFEELPADIRDRFRNDPQRFVEFCSDEKNLNELRELGLARPEVPEPPEVIQKVEVVNKPEG